MPASKPSEDNTSIFWIAYSGGLDSHVLLHKLVTNPPGPQLKAVHIHHNLSPNADQWDTHCRQTCENLGVDYQCIRVDAKSKPGAGESPEAAARAARYAAFASLMNPGDYLLTAHHQDDQAETLLLQLFRGAGIKGLAAMPQSAPFAHGYLLRPLLTLPRQELLDYATEHKLSWIEDESNTNINFDRNYIRHQVLPLIQKRWPAITPTLARVANHCAEADELLDKLAESSLRGSAFATEAIHFKDLKNDGTLSIKQLLTLSNAEQNNLLRYWLHSQNFPTPSAKQLYQLKANVLHSKPDACPLLHWAGVNIRRYRDNLYALPDNQPPFTPPDHPIIWDMKHPLTLPDGRVLSAELCPTIPPQTIEIRFRHQVPKSLKKHFQKWSIPPWERDSALLLYINNKLIYIL